MEVCCQVDKSDLRLKILLIFHIDAIIIISWMSLIFSSFLLIYKTRSMIFVVCARKFAVVRPDSDDFAAINNKKVVRACPPSDQGDGKGWCYGQLPFISILLATYNESAVIARFLKTCSTQTYPAVKFEVVIVDDSTDDTFDKILKFSSDLPNLKAIHRDNRDGWKGGALDVAIGRMNPESSFAIIVDADSVLLRNTLEEFVREFDPQPDMTVVAVQGFPISKACLGDRMEDCNEDEEEGNWVSRAIDFRLANRNAVEFFAKQRLGVPVQLTGNLFMIRADALRSTRFRSDLCEDWNLTLDLYIGNNHVSMQEAAANHHQFPNEDDTRIASVKPVIVFEPRLLCYCEATTRLGSYFKQRMRVSEGHTRAFRRSIVSILRCKRLSLKDKYEFAMMGFQYAKLIVIPIIIILDISLVAMISQPPNAITATLLSSFIVSVTLSISAQLASLLLALASIILGMKVCSKVRRYGIKDVANLFVLNILTIPAIFTGSLKGLLNNKGAFYRTERNIVHTIQNSEA